MNEFDVTKRYEYIAKLEKHIGSLVKNIKEKQSEINVLTDEYNETLNLITILKTKSDDELVNEIALINKINKLLP